MKRTSWGCWAACGTLQCCLALALGDVPRAEHSFSLIIHLLLLLTPQGEHGSPTELRAHC